ncbi:MAG: carbohydrate ABC transporter permease [Clostridiales bacterium]|nr:carbohydrate ABC transporter permease [Clostridiales bacterium]
MRYKKSLGDYAFYAVAGSIMILLSVITLYPFLYVLFASLSEPSEFMLHKGLLLYPLEVSLESYKAVFNNPNIFTGYFNTLFIVIVGTTINMAFSSIGAYFLSRRGPIWKKPIMIMIVITMFIDGGLVPNYLLIQQLGLYNTLWALILPGAINTFNLIIMRTAFQSIPAGLEESMKIDGANDWTILTKLIMPLSRSTMMVMALFYAVSHWNSWFNANIYLSERSKFPLQLVLRDIIINSQVQEMTVGAAMGDSYAMSFTIKYATIIAATVPILVVYPFVQKYFVKGVMIGSLKE